MLVSLGLQHVRTHTQRFFTFHPRLTFFLGPNASGKTNIIEAIYVLALGKSFRAEKETDMVQWGALWAKIRGKTDEYTLDLVIDHHKRFFVNGVPRRQADFVGKFLACLFWPEDVSLVLGSPAIRRDYLNHAIIQVDRNYRISLRVYEKALRQRNKLLVLIHEGKANRDQLTYWNSMLIQHGAYITKQREVFISYLNNASHDDIRGYQIVYDKSVISEERLLQYKDEEVIAKATLVGPHRDDMQLLIRKDRAMVDVASFGSRGEQRLAVLWYKRGELLFLEEKTGIKPVLLLDDIFSELDDVNKQYVFSIIRSYQTIIASADDHILSLCLDQDYELIDLSQDKA